MLSKQFFATAAAAATAAAKTNVDGATTKTKTNADDAIITVSSFDERQASCLTEHHFSFFE